MSIDVDQATVDRWRADGRWIVFGAGELEHDDHPLPACGDPGCEEVPPTWMVEAAKPCETCGGKAKVPGAYHGPADLLFACPDCDDGQRRHPVTVPCEWCAEDGWLMGEPDHYERGTDAWIACDCNPNGDDPHDGRITVPELAVVEWGPLRVHHNDHTPAPLRPCVEVWTDGVAFMWTPTAVQRGIAQRLALPPNIDPQSLIGQWAIGGSITGRDGSIPSPVLGGYISSGFDSPSASRAALEGEAGNGSRPDRQQHGGSIEVAS